MNTVQRILALSSVCLLSGCQTVGPVSISAGRNYYDDVIAQTSAEQLLINIIRSSNDESPHFTDVSSINASVLMQGTVGVGRTNIGAKKGTSGGSLSGPLESLTGSFEYQESPTITYSPTQGYPLIQQIATPISVDNIENLFDSSNWPAGILFTWTMQRLTLNYFDNPAALNAIAMLDEFGALSIAAIKSSDTANSGDAAKNVQGTGAGGASPSTMHDSLALFLQPNRPARKVLGCVDLTQAEAEADVAALWSNLIRFYSAKNYAPPNTIMHHPDSLTLTTTPVTIAKSGRLSKMYSPLISVRTAQGILSTEIQNLLGQQQNTIVILPQQQVQEIRDDNKNDPCHISDADYYYDYKALPNNQTAEHSPWLADFDLDVHNLGNPSSKQSLDAQAKDLTDARRFILIESDGSKPSDADVSTERDGTWYWISNGDEISKRNFARLMVILTIQAPPAPSNGPAQTVSVGGVR